MGFEPVTILAQFGIAIGIRALQSWLSDPPPDDRKGIFSAYPATAEGTPVPIIYGCVRVRQPVVYWYGIAQKRPVSEIEGLGSGDEGDPGLVPHYGLCMLFAIGVPCGPNGAATGARLLAIFDGDTKYECNLGNLDTLQLFGALGVLGAPPTVVTPYHGSVQFFAGPSTQQISDNLPLSILGGDQQTDITEIGRFMKWADKLGDTPITVKTGEIPGYRNVMLVAFTGDHNVPMAGDDSGFQLFLDSFYWGASPSLPRLSFEVICQRPLYTAKLGSGDECPVTVIQDIITRSWSKLGLPSARIHVPSFTAAAATLFAEINGVSIALDTSRQARQVLQDIASQIGGIVYYDPEDDSVHIQLLRNDIDPLTCPSFGPQHIVMDDAGVPQITTIVGGYGVDQINRVTVRFNDRNAGYVDATAVAFNEATAVVGDTAANFGRVRTAPLEYPYVSNIGLARDIAKRDLALLSCPLKKVRVTFNRLFDLTGTTNAARLKPGMGFKLSYANHHVSEEIFRVVKVDPGQLGDNRVAVDCVIDHMRLGTTSFEPPTGTLYRPVPMPIPNRVITEAPRWMQLFLTNQGLLPVADVQRILAVARPDDAATRFSVSVRSDGSVFYSADLTSRQFPPSGRIATAYAVEKEPYDNATGLVIEDMWPNDVVAASIFATSYTEAQIRDVGFTLFLAGGEIMAYESVTNLGGGQWRLNNIWRAQLDTKARDHAAGELVYFIGYAFGGQLYVGKRGHSIPDEQLSCITIPELGFVIGSGDDPIDELGVERRCLLPLRVANLALAGKNITGGVQGVPAVANRFKSATRIEEGLDIHASRRERQTSTIVKGDLADEAPIETLIQYLVRATKLGGAPVTIATLANAAIAGSGGAAGLLLGAAGHGTIDVSVQTIRTAQAGEPGFPVGTVIPSWDEPACRVVAPRWRGLLANSRFDYNALAPGWSSTGSGTASIANNSTSIPRDTTGFYVQEATRSAIIEQIVAVTGYLPRKMTGRLVYYQRNLNADANDTVTAQIDPLDAASASLGGAASQTVTAPTANWERKSINIASLPALTDKLKVSFGWNEIGGGGTAIAEVGITECELIVGQHLYDVLANPSFETGSTASWTNVTNSFVAATAIASPSGNYAQGGAFASSEIRQDYTLLTGWEVGSTAVLRAWRAQTLSSDNGAITLEARDSGGTVLASASTFSENLTTLNQWVRRTLSLDIPAGTVTLRVRLIAVRTLGAGNSGACFDEVVLSVHKEIDPTYEVLLDFDEPAVQAAPRTWAAWYLAYPTLVAAGVGAPIVFAGSSGGPSVCTANAGAVKMRWSDDVTRQPSKLVGQFGDDTAAIDAYVFTRQTGTGALDYQSFAEDNFRVGNPTSETSFTALVLFDIDEVGFATACGLCGRLDTSSGWELGIDATGAVFASVRGTGGAVTVTRAGSTVHDGAKHLAAVVYDAVAQTLTVYDERGSDSASTAAVGEIANTGQSTPFRVGRGRTTIATVPGMIGRLYLWQQALTGPQVQAHFTLGDDPTALVTTYTRSVAAWCPGIPDDDGETLSCLATDQVAIGYDADLTDDGGTGQGLAVQKATGNLVPSFDFAGASWVKDATATLTQGIEDSTGRLHGVTVVSPDVSNGFKLIGVTVGAGAAIQLVFYARALTGTPTLSLELMNASDVVKNTQACVLSTSWKRYEVAFTSWDASSATCRIRWKTNGASVTFDLTHVMFVAQGTEVPTLIPHALASIAAVTASLTPTAPTQLNAEGELIAVGVATLQSPAQASIVTAKKNVGDGNRRELQVGAAQVPQFDHYDSAGPTDVASEGTAIDWRELWTLRGRWCSLGTLDNAANAFAGIVVTGSVNSSDYDRAATWTYDANVIQSLLINIGAQPAMTGYLRSITLRAREQKLV